MSGNIILAADVSAFEDKKLFSDALKLVSPERLKKTENYRFDRDKHLSVGAEILLKGALKKFGFNAEKAVFSTGRNGKPYIENAENLFFNISHSGAYVMCCVSDGEIGCDIEKITDFKLKVADRILTENEKNIVNSITDLNEKSEIFFRLWTLKESFLKYTGDGITREMNTLEIRFQDTLTAFLNEKEQNCFFGEFDIIPGYKCSVCGEKPFSDDKLIIENIVNLTAKSDY